MTLNQVRKMNKKFRTRSKVFRFIKRYVNKNLGDKLLSRNYEQWDDALYKADYN